MATLFNTRISDTYPGLIKTTDNAAISATLKQLSDGSGNLTGLYLNNAGDFKVTSILEFGSLKDTAENITISKFVDAADGIGNNNNDTSIPTSAAIVSYVAAQITAEDLDFTGDDASVAGDVDLNSEQFRILGTANEIETSVVSAGGNQLRIGIPTNPTLSGNVTITGDLNISQGEIINIGSNFDLYATASGEYIQYGSNPVIFNGDADVIFRKKGSEEKTAVFTPQGAAELYFNNTKRLETLTGGAKVTGDLTVTGSITGSGGSFLPLAGGTMTGSTIHNDNVKSIYGTASDGLEIYHDSSHSYLKDSGTGELKILSSSVAIQSASGGEYIAYFAGTGGQTASLYAGNVKKLETSATGITVTGSVTGNLIGNVTGNVTGDVTGDLTGNVTASSVLANGVTATTQADSDDSTKVATTAFVKSLNNASDLDFSGDSGTGDVTLNSQTFTVIGTTNEVETTASNQQLQIGLPSSISVNSASATALQTARDISLTGQATATISGFDGSSDVSGAVTLDNNSVTGKVLTGLASPTASNILASDTILEAFGKTQSQLNTLAGGLRFMGTWNANTNTPTLQSGGGEADSGTTTGTATNKLIQSGQNFTSTVTNGDKVINQASGATALVTNVDSNTQLTLDADIMVSGQEYTIDNSPFITQGHYFVVSVGGTSSLNGLSNWAVGDWVIAGAGNVWEKLDHTQVDGTGTAGKIAKFSSTNVIADSIMSESGSTVTTTGINKSTSDTYVLGSLGVGTEAPSRPLSVHRSSAGSVANFLHYTDASNFSGMYINVDQSTDVVTLNASGSSGANWEFQCGNTQAMTLSATLMDVAGDVKLDSKLIFDYGGDHYLQSGTNSLAYKTSGGTSVVSFNATTLASTFAGDVTISGAEYVNQIQARTSAGLKLGNDNNSGFVFVADNGQVDLDSGNSEIHLKGGGTNFGKFFKSGDNFYINNPIQDKDIIFSGDDGGSSVTALTLDMSDAGYATFNYGVKAPFFTSIGGRSFFMDNTAFVGGYSNGAAANGANDLGSSTNQWRDLYLSNNIIADGDITLDSAGDITLDAGGNDIRFFKSGTEYGKFKSDSSNFDIFSSVENKDIRFKGNDGGTTITALTLDMSNGGSAVFNDDIDLAGNINITGSSKVIRLDGGGYIDFDSTNLQFNTQRHPNTGVFNDTGKSHAHIGLQGPDGGSQINFGTADANNTVATTRMTIASNGRISMGGTTRSANTLTLQGSAPELDITCTSSSGRSFRMTPTPSGDFEFIDKTANVERFRIDANGHFGIAVSPTGYYGDQFVVKAPDENGITIASSGADQKQYICFADGVSGAAAYTGYIAYDHNDNSMSFANNGGNNRMTINSGGDVHISPGDLFLNSGTSYNDKGVIYLSNERTAIISDIVDQTANGDTSVDIQTRKSGTRASALFIDEFRKVGIDNNNPNNKLEVSDTESTTGGTYVKVSRGADSSAVNRRAGIKLGNTASNDGSNWIVQANSDLGYFDNAKLQFIHNAAGTGTERLVIESDGAIRAKTGSFVVDTAGQGIYLGGTGAANLLSDYEEGNWTPQIYYQNSTDQGNATNTTQVGKYTKIGNLVTIQFRLIWTITGSPATDNIGIKNLPFNGQSISNNSTYAENPCVLKGYSNPSTGGRGSLTMTIPNNSQYIALFNDSNMVGNMGGVIGAGTHEIRFQLTYMTDQ